MKSFPGPTRVRFSLSSRAFNVTPSRLRSTGCMKRRTLPHGSWLPTRWDLGRRFESVLHNTGKGGKFKSLQAPARPYSSYDTSGENSGCLSGIVISSRPASISGRKTWFLNLVRSVRLQASIESAIDPDLRIFKHLNLVPTWC